jgi:2',3'-cyclic-nucleotide 2'-phosphodiesterase (5'-nucleotidase family)
MGKLAMTNKTANGLDRRTFLATSIVAAAFAAMSEPLAAQTSGKKTFTIVHTNDLHSNLIGMAPAADFTPLTLNDVGHGALPLGWKCPACGTAVSARAELPSRTKFDQIANAAPAAGSDSRNCRLVVMVHSGGF